MQKAERQARKEEPLPEIKLPSSVVPEPSLAVTQPHVAPEQPTKAKVKRAVSAKALRRNKKDKVKGMEIAQKLEKRKGREESKKAMKSKAKQLWE